MAIEELTLVPNYVGGKEVISSSSRRLEVFSPTKNKPVAEVSLSTKEELDAVVKVAAEAQKAWQNLTVKDRVQYLFKFRSLVEQNIDRLSEICSMENGKTVPEAKAGVLKGIECIDFAISLPQLIQGEVLEVSRGVECKSTKYPAGVVAGITPFNFPAMVPMWMFPLAIACGNAFILKPSEQTPLSAIELAKLFTEAGFPDGLLNVVNGDKEIVEAICDHPGIKNVAFVGSTKVAKLVYGRCANNGKRVRALGGAKNHLVVVPDADVEMTASNILASFTGCAGQRCMAASVVVAVGKVNHILDRVKELAKDLVPGKNLGAIISQQAKERITGYIDRAEKDGITVELDGRKPEGMDESACFLSPTILDGMSPDHETVTDEIFGPVVSVIHVDTLDEAIELENKCPYGNAAAIYTTNGGVAQYFTERANAGMIGINIGVPVPREPFAFGGWFDSRFGDGDITGESAIDFWTETKKVTSKWSDEFRTNWMS